jgi:hypothetical protein
VLDKIIDGNTAKTDRYIIQIAQRAVPKLVNKIVWVVLHDKEALQKIPETAIGNSIYEFEVNFAEDEDEPNTEGQLTDDDD